MLALITNDEVLNDKQCMLPILLPSLLTVQSPLTQFRTANDVVMFQLDHFRAAAKQVPVICTIMRKGE